MVRQSKNKGGNMSKSRRFRVAMITAAVLAIVGFIAFLISPEHIGSLGTFLSFTVMPIISVYILGETARPSGTLFKQTKHTKDFNNSKPPRDEI